ncbi:EAL domain-containing protein [Robertmurraya korlensis]|uniref:sensor domain-containing protein n=1 Tax=Robertmurraya korlensis TaxID=519977 RepID=UPI00203BC64F|nr:EAL domain-containing protein [Robertmurraya korlensis]
MKGNGVCMWKDWGVAKKAALNFVIIYITISSLWVLLSDYIFKRNLNYIPEWMNTSKGLAFIILSGIVFYNLLKKMIKDIIKDERYYRLIVENASDLIVVIDQKGKLEYISPSLQSIVGYHPQDYIGKTVKEIFCQEEITKLRYNYIQGNHNIPIKYKIKNKSGRTILLEGKGVSIADEEDAGRYIILVQDITERDRAERKLLESEERYRKLVEFSPETTLIHKNREIIYVNQAGLKLIGAHQSEQVIGRDVLDFIYPEDLNQAIEKMKQVKKGISEISEYRILKLDGTVIFTDIMAFLTTYEGEEAVQVIIRDISKRKKAEEQVQLLAYYDSLTGMANRNLLYEHLNEVVTRNEKSGHTFAVMFLDLDRFKMINDTYGHSFGDLLLQKVSTRLTNSVGEEGKIFRYGGDEFIIVLETDKRSKVSETAEKIIYLLASPFVIKDRQMFISTSIGISIYPKDGENVESLIQNSDIAMYNAKENGKNNFQYYTSSLNLSHRRRMELETGLRNAITNNELSLYYQPQVDLVSNRIIGLEALIRWKHPEFGFISPAEFIPLAEETGLIFTIGKWVLKTACTQCKQWIDLGLTIEGVAVNVSPLQFREKNFVASVNQILEEYDLEPRYLELEITESVTSNVEQALSIMKKIKDLGVKFAIDDFGTGYSSLNYLRHFPIDKLKIDKSFIDEINQHEDGEVIVKTIIELGNRLRFQVIAEGVENEQQMTFLKENSCYFAQGYYFSKPLPAKEIEVLLRKQIVE